MPTQKDLAKRFNVSQVTVSRALNGSHGVREDLRKKIQKAASKMGYDLDLNFAARSMRNQALGKDQKTNVFCVILSGDIDHNSFEGRLLNGINQEANSESNEIVVVMKSVNELPLVVLRRQVDGLIHMVGDIQLSKGSFESPVPWVSVFFDIPEVPLVTVDNESAGKSIGRHLASKGHTNVAYIGPDFQISHERLKGIKKSLSSKGAKMDKQNIVLEPFSLNSVEYIDKLEERGVLKEVTAISCYNDYLAMNVIRYLATKKIRVPDDISITGFDGAAPREYSDIHLCTEAIPLEELGREAVRLLDSRIKNKTTSRQQIILETELVEGETVLDIS